MLPTPPSWPYSDNATASLCLRLSRVLQPWPFPAYTIDNHWLSCTVFARQSSVVRHAHRFYEGFVILHGTIDLITPWQTQCLEAGSLLVFSPGAMHQWQTGEQPCLALALSFDLDRQLITPTRQRWPVCPDVLWELLLLLADIEEGTPGWQQRAHCRLGAVYARMLSLLERHATPEPDAPGASQLVTRVDELLLAHLARPLTLEALGGHVSMSARHLSRVFRALTGTTVHERLEHIRLERAAKLLCTTNLPIVEVAHAVGISDAAYFARRFRRHFELPPHVYRAQAGVR